MKKPIPALWAFPTKGAPAPAKTPQNPPAAPKAPPPRPSRTVEASPKGARQGGSSPPPAKKPASDPPAAPAPKAKTKVETVEDLLGNPARHPITGQELAPCGPGRAPRLQHKIGPASGCQMYRYEGDEHWHNNMTSALHSWIAQFQKYFPKETVMLADAYRAVCAAEDDLLS